MIKRGFDIVASMAGLVSLAPMFVIVAVVIKLDSAGPVFFQQERVGRGLNPFRIIKFRTMSSETIDNTQSLSVVHDTRITRAGRWLRRLKIDEFPQLVNVLKGDMSLIGPRPELRRYVELRRRDYELEVHPLLFLLCVQPYVHREHPPYEVEFKVKITSCEHACM